MPRIKTNVDGNDADHDEPDHWNDVEEDGAKANTMNHLDVLLALVKTDDV